MNFSCKLEKPELFSNHEEACIDGARLCKYVQAEEPYCVQFPLASVLEFHLVHGPYGPVDLPKV